MRLKEKVKLSLKKLGLLEVARRVVNAIRFLISSIYYALEPLTRPIYYAYRYVFSYFAFILRRRHYNRRNNEVARGKNIISLLCPTRGRPRNVRRLVRSVYRTAVFPERVEILFYIDSDDSRKSDCLSFINKAKNSFKRLRKCEAFVGMPISVSKSWDIIARKSHGDLLMLANDDMIFVDYGWDERLDREVCKYPDQIFCMWFNDGGFQRCLAVFPIVSRRWVETLGYFTPGIFEFSRNDTWIFDIACRVNRLHYIGDMLVEHVHYLYNRRRKARFDKTYERQDDGRQERDRELFEKTKNERQIAANKLAQVMWT